MPWKKLKSLCDLYYFLFQLQLSIIFPSRAPAAHVFIYYFEARSAAVMGIFFFFFSMAISRSLSFVCFPLHTELNQNEQTFCQNRQILDCYCIVVGLLRSDENKWLQNNLEKEIQSPLALQLNYCIISL